MYDDNTGTDGRISTLFHDSTADIEPDVSGLVRGGIDRGRIKRRRQNVGMAFAAAAAVGIVGVAASVAPGLSPSSAGFEPAGAPTPAAASETSAVARPKATQPKTKPGTPPPIPVTDIPVKAADLPRLFTKLYPGKVTPAEQRTGRIMDDGRAGQYAHFLWNGFTTTVAFVAYSGTPAQRCRELQQDANPPITCVKRQDGSFLIQGQRGTAPARDGGGTSQGASLITKDGYEIFIMSYNTARKEGPILAAEPPFSLAQLTRAVTSDVWFR